MNITPTVNYYRCDAPAFDADCFAIAYPLVSFSVTFWALRSWRLIREDGSGFGLLEDSSLRDGGISTPWVTFSWNFEQ